MEVHILAGMLLGIQSYWDIRHKEIPSSISVVGGLLGFILSVQEGRDWFDISMALLPGISLLAIGWISKECIGYGDGIIICVLGLFYSWDVLWRICYFSFFFSAGAALVLFVVLKKSGDDTIPFVPFLMLGWFVNMWI